MKVTGKNVHSNQALRIWNKRSIGCCMIKSGNDMRMKKQLYRKHLGTHWPVTCRWLYELKNCPTLFWKVCVPCCTCSTFILQARLAEECNEPSKQADKSTYEVYEKFKEIVFPGISSWSFTYRTLSLYKTWFVLKNSHFMSVDYLVDYLSGLSGRSLVVLSCNSCRKHFASYKFTPLQFFA